MSFNYAQINEQNKVAALSQLHSAVEGANMIALDNEAKHSGRLVQLGDLWTGAEFVEVTE